ncbi:MAG: phosphatase PAP2 family protein [Candidatus Rokubacteria bacterium]|nr:phosphatase PAP2 family protein [Candidatus Rokubacteria bacterium]
MTRVALLRPRGVLAVTLVCFAALAGGAALAGVLPADEAVRDALLDLASPPVVTALRVVNAAGDWRALLPGTVMLLVVFPRARARWWLWLGLMLIAATGPDVVKAVVGRPRPGAASYGFPSGHATAAAAYFGALVYLAGSLRPPAPTLIRAASVVMIVLVAVARVVLRAHWPSDALGGIALGLALASATALLAASSFSEGPARAPRGS